ncbi:hypothetical protein Ade02nite_19750 [Paractinoplanes deccanensis]|uniref:Uncharacterized protein n=1 Tax=Paractinoplanes deccanensis TaxID=113561 RepID=A0ABQ3Y026_9ACTN|nr:hypothetical protein [Actinoplanes deccanensis]GID73334.1 hypothetical protein Ade02nite_19750 [Actinoplanes deccanensis]
MAGYADGELLVAEWLQAQLGAQVHADPDIAKHMPFHTPAGHVQRAAGEGDTALTVDSMILDVDWYAEDADPAREYAHRTWNLMRLNLPLHTFGNGVLCKAVFTISAPSWAPATGVFRRSAAYRVILHGLI